MKVDEKYGYIFYFKEGEPKMSNKKPHVHIWGHSGGNTIFSFSSPSKKEMPKNFPEREESKLKQVVKEKWQIYLTKWEEAKNK